MAVSPQNGKAPAAEAFGLTSPDHLDAAAVAEATRLEFDQVAGRASMRSPVFLGSADGLAVSATLIFDSQLGYFFAFDLMGPRVGRFNRLVDPMDVSRPAFWRRRERCEGSEAETIFCGVAQSLLLRYRDIGLSLELRGAHDDLGVALPAHFLQGFISRVERGLLTGVGSGPEALER